MGRQRRRYDDKFRASAVVMLEAAGYPGKEGALMEVARHLSTPHPTLHRWFTGKNNPPPFDVVQEEKKELTNLMDAFLNKVIMAMPDKIEESSLQQCATSFGIVVDKKQLLGGKPTEIVELDHTFENSLNKAYGNNGS